MTFYMAEALTTDTLVSDNFELNIRLTVFMSILMFPNLDNWVIWLYLSPENNILSFTVLIHSLSFHFKCHYINYYLVHFKSTSYCPVFIKWLSFCPKTISKSFRWFQYFQLFGCEGYTHLLTLFFLLLVCILIWLVIFSH